MTSLAEAIDEYIAIRRGRREIVAASARVIRECLRVFAKFIGPDQPLGEIGRRDIERWLGSMECADATLGLRLSAVRCFLQWCVVEGQLASDPTLGIKGPTKKRRLPRTINRTATERIIAGAVDAREKLMLTLMLEEGLRAMEVASLEMGDIDLDALVMIVHGKGGHTRTLPITDDTHSALNNYFLERGHQAGPVLLAQGRGRKTPMRGKQRAATTSYITHPTSPDGLSAAWIVKLMSAAVKREVHESGHALRHTFARRMIENKAPMMAVRDALGHASISTTQIYTGFAEIAELRKYMDLREAGKVVQQA